MNQAQLLINTKRTLVHVIRYIKLDKDYDGAILHIDQALEWLNELKRQFQEAIKERERKAKEKEAND